eukprot:6915201-Ditylum_brightwellii.AAC.1
MFCLELKEWKGKDPADKAWSNFKKIFMAAYDELHENEDRTVRNLGYHQANIMSELSSALDTLAMAAVSEKKVMEELMQVNVTWHRGMVS